MVLDTLKENLCVNKLIATKKEIIFVEGDMIVPDSKPDVLNTICTSGVVCLYKKETMDDKMMLNGSINTYIMYLAEDSKDKVRGLCTNIDFSESINIPNCKEGMSSTVKTNIKSIEARVINERKIGIKATLEVCINIYLNENVEIVNDIQNTNCIQMLKEDLKVNSLVGMGNTKVYAKDTIMIDNIDNLAEILKVNMYVCNQDVKVSYNKILTKAEIEVKIMYLTEDSRINRISAVVPVVGFIDIADVVDNNICDINYDIKNVIIKPNQVEEHSIYVEVEVDIMATVYEEKSINLIQDLYSPNEDLCFNTKNVTTITNKRNNKEMKQIRERINLEGMENRQIIDVDVTPIISNESRSNSRVTYEGELDLRFMLIDENMQIESKSAKLPFDYSIDNIENVETTNSNLAVEVMNKDFMIQDGGNINSNIDLMMMSDLYNTANINLMDELESRGEREEQDYSIVIYIVKKGDTLWKIAKRFGSTVEDIARVNGIENPDKIYPGDKIFIPRYVRQGASGEKSPMMNYV